MTTPDSSDAPFPTPARSSISLFGLLSVFGVSLIVFGENDAKLVGFAYLGLAVGWRFILPAANAVIARLRTSRVAGSLGQIPVTWTNPLRLAIRSLTIVLGLALAGLAWQIGDEWPGSIRLFYALFAGIMIVAAATWRAGKEPTFDSSRTARYLLFFIGALAITAQVVFCVWYSTNVPYWDEIWRNFQFILDYPTLAWSERATRIMERHWEHRIVTTYVFSILEYALWNHLDFYVLALVADAFLFAMVFVLYRSLRPELRGVTFFVPFLLILFQPQYYAVTLYSFSIANLGVLFFAVLTWYLLDRPTPVNLCLAALASAGAALTYGSGILVAPIGLFSLLATRRYRAAMYWLIPTTLITFRFFDVDIEPLDERLRIYGWAKASALQKLQYFVAFLGTYSTLGYYSADIRTFTEPNYVTQAAFRLRDAASVVSIFTFAYITIRRYWERNSVIYGLALFTVLTAISGARMRSSGTDTGSISVFATRYAINSVLLAGLLYLALSDLHIRFMRKLLPATIVASALFCGFSYAITLPYVKELMANVKFPMLMTTNGLYQQFAPKHPESPMLELDKMEQAFRTYAYRPPLHDLLKPFESQELNADFAQIPEGQLTSTLLYIGENEISYTFAIAAPEQNTLKTELTIGVLLSNSAGEIRGFEARPLAKLPGHSLIIKPNCPDGTTHLACVYKSSLMPGDLSVALFQLEGTGGTRMPTPYAVPTIINEASLLPPLGAARVTDATGYFRRDTPQTAHGYCSPQWINFPAPAVLTPYSIETLVRPNEFLPRRTIDLWVGPPGQAYARPLCLSYSNERFIVSMGIGTNWEEVTSVRAIVSTWNWVVVTVQNGKVALVNFTAQAPNLMAGNAEVAPPAPPSQLAGVQIGTGLIGLVPFTGRHAAEIREVRVSEGILDWARLAGQGLVPDIH